MPQRFGFTSKEQMVEAIIRREFIPAGKDLFGIDLSGAAINTSYMVRVLKDEDAQINFGGCDLAEANFSSAVLSNVCFRGAILDGATFDDAQLTDCNFCWAKARAASFVEFGVTDCLFNDADLTLADMRGASFFGAEFLGADLSRADLRAITASKVALNFACLDCADLRDGAVQALLERGSIAGVSSTGARFDSRARIVWGAAKVSHSEAQARWYETWMADRRWARESEVGNGVRFTPRGIELPANIRLAPEQVNGEVVAFPQSNRHAL